MSDIQRKRRMNNSMGANIFGVDYVPHADAVKIPFLTGLIIFTVCWFAARALMCFFRKKYDLKHEAKMILMYINLAVLFRITFFPMGSFGIRVDPLIFDAKEIFPPSINLIPFKNMFDFASTRDMVLNIVGNVFMFVPTGIILPVIYKKLRSFPRAVLAGGLISLSIEVLQLLFCERMSDIDDLILNTAGVMIGYGCYVLIKKVRKKT